MKTQDKGTKGTEFILFERWIYNFCSKSRSPLLRWVANSLKRDINYSVSRKFRKGIHFFMGMVTAKFYLRKCTKIGKRVRTYDRKPFIDNAGTMIFGDDIILNSRNVRSDFVTRPGGIMEIGSHNHINFGASFVAANKIKIGDKCHFGPYCFILDSNAHLTQGDPFQDAPGEPVIIEDNVWLASHVIVLKGSLIGKGSTIAAGSVVSGYIPPYTIAGGVPARVIKYLNVPNGEKRAWVKKKSDQQIPSYIKKQVNQVVCDTMGISDIDVDNWKPSNLKNWDSFKQLQLMENLERSFDILLSDKDIVRMTTIPKIYNIVAKKCQNRKDKLISGPTDKYSSFANIEPNLNS